MSFNQTPFHKGGSSKDVQPLGNAPRHPNMGGLPSATAPAGPESAITYGEEERFELLSAYIDDEVTAEERQLVDRWLMDDANTLNMYRRLLMLRQALRTAPIYEPSSPQVPTPPKRSWDWRSMVTLRRTFVFIVAIALIGSMTHLSTSQGQQQLQKAWQWVPTCVRTLC